MSLGKLRVDHSLDCFLTLFVKFTLMYLIKQGRVEWGSPTLHTFSNSVCLRYSQRIFLTNRIFNWSIWPLSLGEVVEMLWWQGKGGGILLSFKIIMRWCGWTTCLYSLTVGVRSVHGLNCGVLEPGGGFDQHTLESERGHSTLSTSLSCMRTSRRVVILCLIHHKHRLAFHMWFDRVSFLRPRGTTHHLFHLLNRDSFVPWLYRIAVDRTIILVIPEALPTDNPAALMCSV